MNKIILLLALASLVCAEYNLKYTAYKDNFCGAEDAKMTGQIFPYTCAPEYLFSSPSSGKITFVNEEYLTSCDYSDLTCGNLMLCENYTRNTCFSSKTVSFSNKYSWSLNNGVYTIEYSSYTVTGCSGTANVVSTIQPNTCGLEYQVKPSSGKITYITDQWLTSCDYSDTNCQNLILCVNYTNSFCNAANFTSFSDKYSWTTSSAPLPTPVPASTQSPSASPSSSPSNTDDSGLNYRIAYVAFDDNSCSTVDESMSGEIFAHKCSAEYRSKGTTAGMIIFINDDHLVSCDYNDLQCSDLKNCENYTNNVCANSDSNYSFSNKYQWTQSNGVYAITYTSYGATGCDGSKVSSSTPIVQNYCSPEYTATPQSGMITAINDDYLISCDYSDTECKSEIVCETYYNRRCYASDVTSFSNLYAWTRSSATSVAAGVFLATIAAVFAML